MRSQGKFRQAVPELIDTFMRTISFSEWLEQRAEDVPDIGNLALTIAKSGATGVTKDSLHRVIQISSETLEDLLGALVATGQVVALKVNGRLVYRTTM
jgi:hypothetical protein